MSASAIKIKVTDQDQEEGSDMPKIEKTDTAAAKTAPKADISADVSVSDSKKAPKKTAKKAAKPAAKKTAAKKPSVSSVRSKKSTKIESEAVVPAEDVSTAISEAIPAEKPQPDAAAGTQTIDTKEAIQSAGTSGSAGNKNAAASAMAPEGKTPFTTIKPFSDISKTTPGHVKEMIDKLIKDESEGIHEENVQAGPETKAEPVRVNANPKIYRKIAYFFALLVIVLGAAVFYFTYLQVTITLIPNQERVSNNLIIDIADTESGIQESGSTISGIVRETELEISQDFPTTGTEVIGKEVSGIITLHNNYNKNQPLVASTRLLTPDNKLFRIKSTVNVPAGSSIDVEVYADDPGPELSVPAKTKFTIPGLWAGLQEQIYGENPATLDYKQKVKKSVLAADIDNAAREIKQLLLAKAKTEISDKYKDYSEVIYKINENSIQGKADKEIGAEAETLKYSMSASVVAVAFDEKKTAALAKQKFLSSLSETKEMVSFDNENIVYILNNFDVKKGTANINATFEGRISIKGDTKLIEPATIAGLSNEQLEAFLKSKEEIAGYEIKYNPSFFKRVPKLADKIIIEIKK